MTLNEKLRNELEYLNQRYNDFTYAFDEASGCVIIVSRACGDVIEAIIGKTAGDLGCFISRESKAVIRIVTPTYDYSAEEDLDMDLIATQAAFATKGDIAHEDVVL